MAHAERTDNYAPAAFVDFVRARDFDGLLTILHPEARFRALIPPGPVEDQGAEAIAGRLRSWFEAWPRWEFVEGRAEPRGDRHLVTYRFRVGDEEGETFGVEHHAFVDLEDGSIVSVDLLCGGLLAEPSTQSAPSEVGKESA